jgi:hypothetical protein
VTLLNKITQINGIIPINNTVNPIAKFFDTPILYVRVCDNDNKVLLVRVLHPDVPILVLTKRWHKKFYSIS